MPRTGNTWTELLLSQLSGFIHLEKRHKLNNKYSELKIPQISFFRNPADWYLSMYNYYQERRSGDIYACLNDFFRFKNVFWRETRPAWQGRKILICLELLKSLSSSMRLEMSFQSFVEGVNSKHAMTLMGYGGIYKKYGFTLYQAMFFDAVCRNDNVSLKNLKSDELFFLIKNEKLKLIDLDTSYFEDSLFSALQSLGFNAHELHNIRKSGITINRNATKNCIEEIRPGKINFPQTDIVLYSLLRKLAI